MPLFQFECLNASCDGKFEELCKFSEIDELSCPECNSKEIKRRVTVPALHFDIPQESSKWDNFEYRAEYNLEKAQKERRNAEMLSHMGEKPYLEQERVDLGTKDINSVQDGIV